MVDNKQEEENNMVSLLNVVIAEVSSFKEKVNELDAKITLLAQINEKDISDLRKIVDKIPFVIDFRREEQERFEYEKARKDEIIKKIDEECDLPEPYLTCDTPGWICETYTKHLELLYDLSYNQLIMFHKAHKR